MNDHAQDLKTYRNLFVTLCVFVVIAAGLAGLAGAIE